jgi:hypothetical protein
MMSSWCQLVFQRQGLGRDGTDRPERRSFAKVTGRWMARMIDEIASGTMSVRPRKTASQTRISLYPTHRLKRGQARGAIAR